jgi:hypothetical protein
VIAGVVGMTITEHEGFPVTARMLAPSLRARPNMASLPAAISLADQPHRLTARIVRRGLQGMTHLL